jgi:hypothetical protein
MLNTNSDKPRLHRQQETEANAYCCYCFHQMKFLAGLKILTFLRQFLNCVLLSYLSWYILENIQEVYLSVFVKIKINFFIIIEKKRVEI